MSGARRRKAKRGKKRRRSKPDPDAPFLEHLEASLERNKEALERLAKL